MARGTFRPFATVGFVVVEAPGLAPWKKMKTRYGCACVYSQGARHAPSDAMSSHAGRQQRDALHKEPGQPPTNLSMPVKKRLFKLVGNMKKCRMKSKKAKVLWTSSSWSLTVWSLRCWQQEANIGKAPSPTVVEEGRSGRRTSVREAARRWKIVKG